MNPASQVLVNKQQSMMPSSSGASRNSAGAGDGDVPDKFPDGLRVLAVDDDRTCLMILEGMLRKCKYEVTKCHRAEVALSLLRENKNGFDVVISDVHMPDMDGFKLLVHIGLEMDLPVIMLSADDSKSVVMKGVTHGACDYLIKPVSIHSVRNIWQHVVRKKKHEKKDIKPSTSLDDCNRNQKQPEDNSSSANEGQNGKNTKRRKDDEDEIDERDDTSSSKKPRVVWSQELHQQFVAAVSQLGFEKAVPKKILDLMNVPGLTRENVASHLQKFRLYLRRLSVTHPSGGFMDNPDAGYGSISSHSELDIQALAASGQLPGQTFANLQVVALGRSANPKSPISADQKNIFSFDNPKIRYGQQVQNWQGQNSNIGKPTNLLHGIPTTMEPEHLMGLQRSFMNSQGLIPMTVQSQSQSQIHNHASRLPVLPNPAFSQASSLVNFSKTESNGNNYPLGGSLGISPSMSTTTLQRERLVPNYGISNNANQNKPHDWGLQGVITSTNTNNMQGLNVVQHNYNSGQKMGGSEVIYYMGEGSGTDSLVRAKVENVNYGSSRQSFIPEEYNQDDLLTVILSQQPQRLQEGTGQPENELINWHSLDNLPV